MKYKWLILITLLSLLVGSAAASPRGLRSKLSTYQINTDLDISATTSDCEDDEHDEDCDFPEMDVKGMGISIPDGDSTPSFSDHTDYGNTSVTGGAISHTFAITNSGDARLSLTGTPKVVLSGTHAADFAVTVQPSSPVAQSGGWTTFTVVCDPSAAGLRTAMLSIANNDTNENPYNFSIQCTGETDGTDEFPTVLSITRAGSDPANPLIINFTVTFSEAVTGVDETDFSLVTTGTIVGAAITAVVDTGDHTTYTVSVDTGTGSGTIRLDIVDDDSIVDSADNPLGGPGTGNGSFTSGEISSVRRNCTRVDFDGNNTTDVAVFHPSTGGWSVKDQFVLGYGMSGDVPVPGDYDGDGDTDVAVFRPSTGGWYVKDQFVVAFGTAEDIPVPGDYNGDCKTDVAFFRPSSGSWHVMDQFVQGWGTAGDLPVQSDYDGDGDTDLAVFRPSTVGWYVKDQFVLAFGTAEDIPVPGDYDSDGDTDVANFRPSTGGWYVMDQFVLGFGIAGDFPVPGDYDGDGDTDVAVFRNGVWYVKDQFVVGYGLAGDIPLPGRDTNGDGDPYQ